MINEDLTRIFTVSNATDYYKRVFSTEELEEFYNNDSNDDEIELITKIIALEISVYILRRTGYLDQSLLESLWHERTKSISDYSLTYNKVFMDYNENIDR